MRNDKNRVAVITGAVSSVYCVTTRKKSPKNCDRFWHRLR